MFPVYPFGDCRNAGDTNFASYCFANSSESTSCCVFSEKIFDKANFFFSQFCFVIFLPTNRVGSALSYLIKGIVSMSTEKEMGRSNAGGIVAGMADQESVGYGAYIQFVGNSMSGPAFPIMINQPVFAGKESSTGPFPAIGFIPWLLDGFPYSQESFSKGASLCAMLASRGAVFPHAFSFIGRPYFKFPLACVTNARDFLPKGFPLARPGTESPPSLGNSARICIEFDSANFTGDFHCQPPLLTLLRRRCGRPARSFRPLRASPSRRANNITFEEIVHAI